MAKYSPKKIIGLKRKIIILAVLLALATLVLICVLISNSDAEWAKILCDVIGSFIAAIISILLFDLYKEWKIEDENEKDSHSQKIVWELMQGITDNCNIIQNYKDNSVDNVVANCLNSYCSSNLAQSYLHYIKDNINTYREDMDYNVTVNKDNTGDFDIKQTITYRRNFTVKENSRQYYFKCFFALRPGALEKRLNESDWFFREEITNQTTIQNIQNLLTNKQKDIKAEIINEINLNLYLYKNGAPSAAQPAIDPENIQMKYSDDGISFIVPIPEDCYQITANSNNPNSSIRISYKAKVTCKIKNSSKNFYCVFTEPTIDPKFTIKFHDSIPVESVNRISCLTFPNNDNTINESILIQVDSFENTICFNKGTINSNNAQEKINPITIFPRSGIYFSW